MLSLFMVERELQKRSAAEYETIQKCILCCAKNGIVWRFVEDIRKGKVDSFMERMQAIIAGIPYDNFSEEKLDMREQNYQTFNFCTVKA